VRSGAGCALVRRVAGRDAPLVFRAVLRWGERSQPGTAPSCCLTPRLSDGRLPGSVRLPREAARLCLSFTFGSLWDSGKGKQPPGWYLLVSACPSCSDCLHESVLGYMGFYNSVNYAVTDTPATISSVNEDKKPNQISCFVLQAASLWRTLKSLPKGNSADHLQTLGEACPCVQAWRGGGKAAYRRLREHEPCCKALFPLPQLSLSWP